MGSSIYVYIQMSSLKFVLFLLINYKYFNKTYSDPDKETNKDERKWGIKG